MLKYQITIGTNTRTPLSLIQSSCTAYDIESSETSHIAPEKDDCHFLYHFTPPKQRDLLLHQCTCQSKDWSETSRKKTRERERERERERVCVCVCVKERYVIRFRRGIAASESHDRAVASSNYLCGSTIKP
jgi:hypothetical protein